MNYDRLTMEEALDILRKHDEADWSNDRLWDEVIEPSDVLYWLDAFGDQSLAINCQGLPKDLPDDVVRKVDEYDVLNDWLGKVSETECPICETVFYEFDWKYDYLYVSEHGDNRNYVEYVTDPAGYFWDTSGEHRIMCQSCTQSRGFPQSWIEPSRNSVRVFYGERDKFSRFSHSSGVIRWDFMWDEDHDTSTDLYNLRAKDNDELVKGREIAASFAESNANRDAMMARLGFKRLYVKKIDQSVKGRRKFWRYAKETLVKWATLDSESMVNEPTHPDLDFTYIIEGEYQAWIPEEHFDKFEAELVWQSLVDACDFESADEYRKSNSELESTKTGVA